jgi:hypothetical protein
MGPFAVSSTGKSIQTALGPDQLLTFDQPLTKLDVTNTVSFQTLSILFNTESPQPPIIAPFYAEVQIYQFPHGYNYIPAIWMEWQNPAPAYPGAPGPGGTATTFFTFGDDSASANIPGVGLTSQLSQYALVQFNDGGAPSGNTMGFFYLIVDEKNVTLYFRKNLIATTTGGALVPLFVIGTTVNMRIYVFTEPATTSTY